MNDCLKFVYWQAEQSRYCTNKYTW